MKYKSIPLLLLSSGILPLYAGGDSTPTQPNIIFFLVDDMGWQDTSLPFWEKRTHLNDQFETPNMERLATQGMKFTQGYACSVSSPTRVSLLTGMNAARHRVTNWTLHKDTSVDPPHETLHFPRWNCNGFSQQPGIERAAHATSLAQVLKDNGYYTIHCGKAHFGAIHTPGEDPLNLGFDINIAGHAAGSPASYLGEDNFGNTPDGTAKVQAVPGLDKYHGQSIFLTEALTLEAINALNERDNNKPFFLYMSHYAVHSPFNKDMRYYDKYRAKGLDETEAAYAALVEGMDKSLGDLMDYLEQKNLSEQTLLIFLSDNGGLSAVWRGGQPHTHNYPLQSGKGSAMEGGIRVPMIVSWKNTIPSNSICEEYVIVEDFFPTLSELAGSYQPSTIQTLDGTSIVPLLFNKKGVDTGRPLYWNFPNHWGPTGPGIGPSCSVRKGDWKLIYYYETGKTELFNIRKDISESCDKAATYPGLVKELAHDLGKYLRSVDAQRPIYKISGQPVPWPDECLF